jgi:autotransporter-associated beta strand protein
MVDVAIGAEQVDAFTRAGSSRLVKSGSGALVLDRANSHSGGVVVQAGTLVVRDVNGFGRGPLTVAPGGRVVFDVGAGEVPIAGLTIDAGGSVELGRGRVTLPPSAYSLTDVVANLKAGRAGGSWAGTSGFTTRHAGAAGGGGLGYVVNDDGSLTVGFAAPGDGNLDGLVDILDVSLVLAASRFNTSDSASWSEGDFNYDGLFDILDVSDILGTALFNAGAYAPDLPDPTQRNLTQEFVPTKVFDAKADFGAVGDNVADDTAEVQACIDAARRWGDGAIAYFPKGTYKVTATINVTGGNYLIGGSSPIHTKIQGHGTANPVVVITDPANLRVEFIDVRHTDQLKTAIRQVSSDSSVPSRIHYDHVYVNHYGTSFVNARTFTGSSGMALEVKDLSSESVLTGYNVSPQLKGMSFENVSDARVLFSQIGTMGYGALRISGTEADRDGFFGILNGYTSYRVADNHSLVISDGYQEQMRPENTPDRKYIATPYMILSGSADLPAGRITVSSNKFDGAGASSGLINSSTPAYETYFTVDNYHGVLSHVATDYKNGSATFDPNKQAFRIVTSGTAPFDVLLMANTYEQGPTGSGPVVEGGSNVSRHLLANWAPGLTSSANKQVPNVTNADTLPLAGQALDDFRKLGSFDLLLNYDIDSPTFPRPTAEQAATYPELPELNWQKRSDWLDVTALPASVNGGRSAVGDGIADDTAAILAACNEVRKSNGRWSTVYLPAGSYKITSTIHPTEGLSSTVDTHLSMRGHGKSTRIVWHGPENGRMFRSDSNTSSSFVGIVWDGRGVAAQGFIHDTSSGGRRETKVLHQYEAFLNFRKEGAGTASGKPDQRYLESSSYRNCIFINCGTGLAVSQANDYMINVEGCHFYDNGIGVYAGNGEFLIRNSRFFRSGQFDIMNDNSAPNSSIRRVSSVGSNAFYRRRGTTVSVSNDQQATLQDCYVTDWKNASFAIQNMAQGATGWDPMLIFDCTFENAPSTNPPIRLDRAAQVVHSNNTWTVGGQARTGAQLFAGQTANLQAVPHTPSARPATRTVSFDAQGGTAPGPASKSVTVGSTYGPLATTSRLGHTFAGWWTAPGGGGTQVTDVTDVAVSSSQTLYARWAFSSVHTVTFDPQGGATPSPATASVTLNTAYGPLATTTRPDHTFEGWWTGPGGTGTLVTAATQVTTAANHTLYAKWATASAGFRYWDNSGGTANDWGGLANWSTAAPGGTNPVALPGTAEVAAFSATPIAGATQSVNLNGNRSLLGLAVTSAVTAAVTLQGGGTNRTLTTGASGIASAGSGSLIIGSGTSGQNVAVTLAGSQRIAANGSGGISFNNTLAGTGSPTLTNAGTGTGYVGLGTLQSTVARVVQDSAGSKLGLRNNNSAFTGGVEIRKGTVMIGTHANNLGAAASIVTLGNAVGGADPVTLEINDNSSPAAYPNPIVLAANTSGLLRILLRDDTGTQTHTFSGGITGTNDLTIENQAEGGNADDKLVFSTGSINHAGALTHVGTGSGDLVINSVIGTNVTGVIQDSPTSRLVLNGANTYSGDTIVNAGMLVVNGNAIPNSGALVLNTGGRVNPSGATETVASLFFDDVQQLAGSWGSSVSTATHKNDTYFTGTGVVLVLSGPDLGPPPTGDESPSGQSAFDPTAAAFASLTLEQHVTDDSAVKKKRASFLA